MMHTVRFKKYIRIIAAAVLLVCMGVPALAMQEATPVPTTMPVPEGTDVLFPRYSQSVEFIQMKSNLYTAGYYVAQVEDSDLRSALLDDYTWLAINTCCKKNGFPYSDYGITREAWEAIINNRFVPANFTTPTPAPEEMYPLIAYHSTLPAVERVQAKLQSLGYGQDMTIGIYDDAMIAAVDEYLRVNNIAYDQAANLGLLGWLQEAIITGDGLPWDGGVSDAPTEAPAVETEKKGMTEKLREYFSRKVPVMGLQIPMIIVWLACMGLIAGCIFLIMFFFVPEDANSRRADSNKRTRRADGRLTTGKIEFQIEYRGQTKIHRDDIDHTLKIGRNVGNFPLFPGDDYVSRKHCEIYYSNRNLMMRDYSENGTKINGRPCSNGEYLLSNGDVLQIGQHRITILF